MKPYYDDQNGLVVYHGKCEEIIPLLRSDIDLVVTDPPYNVGKEFLNENLEREAYYRWTWDWWRLCWVLCRRIVVLPGHGNLDVWLNPPNPDREVTRRPSAIGCWYKPGNGLSSHLGYEEWEPYLYWGTRVGGSSVIATTRGAYNKLDGGGHPTPKPVELMTKLLVKFKPSFVLDPFLGSGTTLVAAKRLGIKGIGIEVDEKWCEVAARRLSENPLFTTPVESTLVDAEGSDLPQRGNVAFDDTDSSAIHHEDAASEGGKTG